MKPSLTLLTTAAMFLMIAFTSAQERCAAPADPALSSAALHQAVFKSSPSASAAAWAMGAKIPVAKQYHTVASLNGEIFVFGGVTANNYYNSASYRYSPATNTWTPITAFPVGRYLFGQAQAVNGKIYIMAGVDNLGTSYKVVPDVWEYDPVANTYSKKTDMPLPQGFCVSGVLEGKIYTIAGVSNTNDAFHKLVQVYDPATDTWSRATDYPRNVKYLSAATVNDKIVVTGGYNNTYPNMYYIADTYVGALNGGVLEWRKVADYPIGPTIYMSGVGVDGKAWFFGGRPSADNNAPATKRSFKYDPTADAWTTLEPKVKGIQALVQAGTDGKKVYLPGGQTFTGFATDTLEIFDTGAQGAPVLALSRNAVDRWVQRSQPVAEPLVIHNNGYADLTWNLSIASGGAGWLSLSASSGTIPPMQSASVELQFDGEGVTNGDHTAVLTLSSNDQTQPSADLHVTVHVQDEPVDEPQNVMIEEFSGTWCGWCPYGADTLKALIHDYPGRVHGVTYHQGTHDPLTTPNGSGVLKLLGVTSYPSAALNRMLDPGTGRLTMGRSTWRDVTQSILAEGRSPLRIEFVSKLHNPATRLTIVRVRVFFHQGIRGDLRLNLIQTESGLNVGQSYFYYDSLGQAKSTLLYPYYHAHAVRAVAPDSAGESLWTGGTHATQSYVEREIWFTSVDSVAEEAELIAFVHRFDGGKPGPILQSHGEKLREGSVAGAAIAPAPSEYFLSSAWPNPFNPSTAFRYGIPEAAHVRITVSDALGRELRVLVDGAREAGTHIEAFDASGLGSGIYYITMRTPAFVRTRAVTLVK